MTNRRRLSSLAFVGILVLCLVSCSLPNLQATSSLLVTPSFPSESHPLATNSTILTLTPRLTLTTSQNPTITPSPSQSLTPTNKSSYLQTSEAILTWAARLSIDCKNIEVFTSKVSPNEEWLAITCGRREDATLIVKNKAGKSWTLVMQDFMPLRDKGFYGSLNPVTWSPDEAILYFILSLPISGGGSICDKGYTIWNDVYGVFKLDLLSGKSEVIIPSNDNGFIAEFSSNRLLLAVVERDLKVIDLLTGDYRVIKSPGYTDQVNWSPDGRTLAYTEVLCDKDLNQIYSYANVWNTASNLKIQSAKVRGYFLQPAEWLDDSTVRFIGSDRFKGDTLEVFDYDVLQKEFKLVGTPTPTPVEAAK